MAHSPLGLTAEKAEEEVRKACEVSYSPAAIDSAVDWLQTKPLAHRTVHLVVHLPRPHSGVFFLEREAYPQRLDSVADAEGDTGFGQAMVKERVKLKSLFATEEPHAKVGEIHPMTCHCSAFDSGAPWRCPC
jgi:hypothetical protein